MSSTIDIHVPEMASKVLKVTKYDDGRRKVQISSNWLPLFAFSKGTKVVEKLLPDMTGYTVTLAENEPLTHKPKKVYSRVYSSRKNNPLEEVFETSSKKILSVLPETCEHVHVTFVMGKLIVRSVVNAVAERIQKMMRLKKPFSCFCACSSGIDAHAAYRQGFSIAGLLERRPHESRDKKSDLSETGALTALRNIPIERVYNEDINTVDMGFVEKTASPFSVFTISLQCNELSNVKAKSLKDQAIEDLTSSIDMAYDGLRFIEKIQPVMVLLEQVPGFRKSDLGRMWNVRLRKWGYTIHEIEVEARDLGSFSPRKRYFNFATSLPTEFHWPELIARRSTPVWDELVKPHLQDLRNVNHSKSLQDGLKNGRLRVLRETDLHCPTPLKSQPHMANDSLVIMDRDNNILWPSEGFLKQCMSIPDDFHLDATSGTVASNIIGQAVDYSVYSKIMKSIAKHIGSFVNKPIEFMNEIAVQPSCNIVKPMVKQTDQMVLF